MVYANNFVTVVKLSLSFTYDCTLWHIINNTYVWWIWVLLCNSNWYGSWVTVQMGHGVTLTPTRSPLALKVHMLFWVFNKVRTVFALWWMLFQLLSTYPHEFPWYSCGITYVVWMNISAAIHTGPCEYHRPIHFNVYFRGLFVYVDDIMFCFHAKGNSGA